MADGRWTTMHSEKADETSSTAAQEEWSRALKKVKAGVSVALGARPELDIHEDSFGVKLPDSQALAPTSSKGESGGTGVKVTVRVRPFIKEEYERDGGQPVLCMHMPTKTSLDVMHQDYEKKSFEFDRTYWSFAENCTHSPHFASQELIYKELGVMMLDHAIDGFNNCIFAYGQTATGKSHSVLGTNTPEGRGLLPRIVHGLFEHFQKLPRSCTCKCLVSFMEIYNEQIRDLLIHTDDTLDVPAQDVERKAAMVFQERKASGNAKGAKPSLEVRQHPILGIIIPGLTEAAVACKEDVLGLIEYGITTRTVGATAMNYCSSRSHCIFSFKTSITNPEGMARRSQTYLVDLAGSERLSRTKATATALKESVGINSSLSALAHVIHSLAENCTPGQDGKKKKASVPLFRNSKLTFILKESLCGNSKTVMMAAVSPSVSDYEETMSTLKFAQSAKRVQTHATVNEVSEAGMQQQLQQQIKALREDLANMTKMRAADAELLREREERLLEAEQICKTNCMSWSERVAAERQRHNRRHALSNIADFEGLDKLQKFYEKAQNDKKVTKDLFGESSTASSSSIGSGRSSSSNASEHSNSGRHGHSRKHRAHHGATKRSCGASPSTTAPTGTTETFKTSFSILSHTNSLNFDSKMAMLMHLDGLSGQGNAVSTRSSLASSSGIAIVGPAGEKLLNEGMDDSTALVLTEEFRELQVLASETQALIDSASQPTAPAVQLRVMVAIDPFDLAAPHLVVTTTRCGDCATLDIFGGAGGAACESVPELQTGVVEEWLSTSQLRARLNWLQSGQADGITGVGDVWGQSKRAWKHGSMTAPKESATSNTSAANRLRVELAAAHADLAKASAELAAERSAAAKVRTALLALERGSSAAAPQAPSQIQLWPRPADAASGTALAAAMLNKPLEPATELEARKGLGLRDLVTACGQQTSSLRQFGADVKASYNEAVAVLDALQATVAPPCAPTGSRHGVRQAVGASGSHNRQ